MLGYPAPFEGGPIRCRPGNSGVVEKDLVDNPTGKRSSVHHGSALDHQAGNLVLPKTFHDFP